MSWIHKLHETYEACVVDRELTAGSLWPVSHSMKIAHVEVIVDSEGNFLKNRARKLGWQESATVIPTTESSAGRTSGIAPHPLCEELSYIASDLPTQKNGQIQEYLRALGEFCCVPRPAESANSLRQLATIANQFVTWFGASESAKKAPRIVDLENAIRNLSQSASLPANLSEVPAFFVESNLTFAKKNTQYFGQLESWCDSEFANKKAIAVLAYLRRGRLWTDLNNEKIFPVSTTSRSGQKTKVDDGKVFVRWRVENIGDPCTAVWEDQQLIDDWVAFDQKQNGKTGFCMVTGRNVRLAQNHPRFLRNSSDGAKIVSANDFDGYTFKGRFTDVKSSYEKQVCSVGFDVSQKAHNALRWLIARQGYRSGNRDDEQVVVSWVVSGKRVPDLFRNTLDLFDDTHKLFGIDSTTLGDNTSLNVGTGQAAALRLNAAMAGYGARLTPNDDAVVMGLHSATSGRMAIIFYRELKGSDLLARVQQWHTRCMWPQDFDNYKKFIGAPAPRDIVEAAYGRWDEKLKQTKVDDKLLKMSIARLLFCIVDGQRIPNDLVATVCRRAANRTSYKKSDSGHENQWEKCLGIACAIFKAHHHERNYQMALEHDRKTRSYLYGRLLAIADHIEGRALHIADEQRDTNAMRLMQRFADHPFSTWRTIETSLRPYQSRLRMKRPKFLNDMNRRLDEVQVTFLLNDFINDSALDGEFLLAYHCQRHELWSPPSSKGDETTESEISG